MSHETSTAGSGNVPADPPAREAGPALAETQPTSAGSKPDSAREGTEVPCEIVSGSQGKPHDDARGDHAATCILPSGHTGPHLCPYDVTVTRRFEASR